MHTTIQTLLTQAIENHRAGRLDPAMAAYRAILATCPDNAVALTNLGSLVRQQGEPEEAIMLLERALAAPGSNEHAASNLGNAYRAAGRRAEAAAAYRQAIERKPDWALAHCNLGVALMDLGQWQEAMAALHHALQLEPGHELARLNLARLTSSRLMSLQYAPVDEALLHQLAQTYGQCSPAPEPFRLRRNRNRHRPGTPLRVGFLSPDLCEHPVGFFLRPLLEKIDRLRIRPFLYSSGGRTDHARRSLRPLGRWCDVETLDDAALLARLRADSLDVLIDLSGHTAGHRLPVFARRAAPTQVSWLGYFATTGVPAMDCVLMDAWHVGDGEEAQFSERVVRLPCSRFCYQPPEFAPAVAPPPVERNGFITFGSFNNTAKYHDETCALWAHILQEVPASRLILKWRDFDDAACRDRMAERFSRHGIDPGRIEMRPFSFHVEVLRQYADIDIALDPFPFSGGHTSCEALWMGVPIITWPGRRPVSRQTAGFIANLGRADWQSAWVADSADDYAGKAIRLARDTGQLALIRQTLRPTMAASPLLDAERFARDFATAIDQCIRLTHPAGPQES